MCIGKPFIAMLITEICPEMHAVAKMAEMAINRQNRQTVNKYSNEMAKGPLGHKCHYTATYLLAFINFLYTFQLCFKPAKHFKVLF